MRRWHTAVISVVLVIALPGLPVSAQNRPELDVAALETRCAANAPDAASLETCLDVVHRYLVPGSGPTVTATPTTPPAAAPQTSGPSLGFTYFDENLAVTPLRIDWAPPSVGDAPAQGRQWVAVFVRYDALTDADFSARDDWNVWDQNDQSGDLIQNVRAPEITGGTLAAADSVEGWLTFELPAPVTALHVTYRDGIFGEAHEWVIPYDAAAGPVVTATPMPTPRVPGLGFTYRDQDVAVTLVRVEWNARNAFLKPDSEDQWVGLLVRYRAKQAADFSEADWEAVDHEGFEANQPLFTPLDPELGVGRLRRGRTTQLWVTMEFPRGVRSIEVVYTADPDGERHVWRVRRR